MKLWATTWVGLMAVCCWCGAARAQLQIISGKDLQSVFGRDARKVAVVFHNSGGQPAEANLRVQLYQASSATTVPAGKLVAWKTLQVLPGQSVLESATLDFPAVKAETKFIVQWQDDGSRVIGAVEVQVYPADILVQLKTLAGNGGPGVFDPQNQLKPILKSLKIEFENLEVSGIEHFAGRLAIIGPFPSAAQMREGLAGQIKQLARRNAGVVWLQPPIEKKDADRDKLTPSFYSVMENTNAIIVAQAGLVAGLAENPQAQLNLIRLCQMALNPRPLTLPDSFARE